MPSRGGKEGATRKAEQKTTPPLSRSTSGRHPQNTRVIQLLKRPRTIVNHSYVDYSLVPFVPEDNELPAFIEKMDFHQKMHSILSQEAKGACGWMYHGRAFRIIDPVQFEKSFCPKYFGHNRYSSFLHQLGLHGYKLLSGSPHTNVYYSQVSELTCQLPTNLSNGGSRFLEMLFQALPTGSATSNQVHVTTLEGVSALDTRSRQ